MSKIEWTDVTWNPVIGCAKVSAGCKNCYAERSAHRVASLQGGGVYLQVLRTDTDERGNIEQVDPRWNGRAVFLPERLGEPLHWRKPRRVFVNSMSDLFHEDITFGQIAAVFGVMAATPHLTYQVLSKRPARMLEFLRWISDEAAGDQVGWVLVNAAASCGGNDARWMKHPPSEWQWPVPNVHIGVSVEDQRSADERIPLLLQCPAALRFLSVEPLLGPVALSRWIGNRDCRRCNDGLLESSDGWMRCGCKDLDLGWVIVGGESGPGARPCGVEWIRSVVEQCRSAGVPVFVKQLGSNPREWVQSPALPDGEMVNVAPLILDRKGADPSEWPDDLRVQESPEVSRG